MGKKRSKQTIDPSKHLTASKEKRLPIVGMGASAGGLEAFEAFFKAMPPDAGMAFVLVSHLDPTHISILPELIKRQTEMEVTQITDGEKVMANHVYVIPPNKDLSILNGTLYLMDLPLPRGLNLPIDNFFRALALDQGADSICIILSGTGTDGTIGAKAIKGELGMVMVQNEDSAKYDGMPRSAIAKGLADYVLSAEKMPDQLIKYTRHAIIRPKKALDSDEEKFQKVLNKIFILLRARTGHDFSLYKKNTIHRRIERRMHVHAIDHIKNYLTYLQNFEKEVHILFKDLLIGVTSFFRDKEAFESLKALLLSGPLKDRSDDDQRFRVWVAACSSGEEAYSIAILIQECMETLGTHFDVQIFGTDIDDDAISTARSGLYPLSISADVSAGRLNRYFTREESHYRVKKSIREMLVFAPHSLIKDPPFTKLDLISCRNLLIYLGPELQQKLFPVFHYSLKQGGILFIGSSESLGQAADLFKIEDKKWKTFSLMPDSATERPCMDLVLPSPDYTKKQYPSGPANKIEQISDLMLVETILEQSGTPPSVIINEHYNIVYVHGRTGNYLEPATGKVSVNILEMARPGLKAVLAATIRKVGAGRQTIVRQDIEVQKNGGFILVDLTVKPVLDYGALRGLIMIIFKETTQKVLKRKPGRPKKDKALTKIELELQYTKENLQSTIEELETSNEELKSTNEELQSTNEELQSTNEELETSKEELQSLNEESATVNAELQSRVDELSKTNDDMKNLLDSTQTATVFLDFDLCIKGFTQQSTELIPLTSTDIGRPLNHLASELKDVDLCLHAKQVLKDLVIKEVEAQTFDSQFYKIRLLPYRTLQNVIDGVVITFENITRFKNNEHHLRRLAALVTDSNDALTLYQFDGSITAWNKGAQAMYGYSEQEALKLNINDLIPQENKEEMNALTRRLKNGERIESFKIRRKAKDGKILDIWLTATLLKDLKGNPEGIATTERDLGLLERKASLASAPD